MSFKFSKKLCYIYDYKTFKLCYVYNYESFKPCYVYMSFKFMKVSSFWKNNVMFTWGFHMRYTCYANDPWYFYVHVLLLFTKRITYVFKKIIFEEANPRSIRKKWQSCGSRALYSCWWARSIFCSNTMTQLAM